MRVLTITLATALLCTAAYASPETPYQKRPHNLTRPLVRVPIVKSDPDWIPDYNIVPRYRYNPRDDRVDTSPYAKPVAPGEPEPGPLGPYTQ